MAMFVGEDRQALVDDLVAAYGRVADGGGPPPKVDPPTGSHHPESWLAQTNTARPTTTGKGVKPLDT